jgi:hypothetical protein
MDWTTKTFPAAGILGLVGGDAASSALAANHVFGRKLIPSFYNSPGSSGLSSRLSHISNARTWDGQHGGVSVASNSLTTSSSASGPRFIASHSGTKIASSGEVAQLLVSVCKEHRTDVVAAGRVTVPTAVTVVNLHSAPAPEEHPTVAAGWSILRLLPIATSIVGTALCVLNDDIWSASVIGVGMLASGLASHALGSGDLTFTRPNTALGAPRGDGYLEADNEVVVLKGEEGAVSAVTRGKFALRYKSEVRFGELALASSLFTAQCVAQLLFVPFGTSFGQLAFLATIGVSWLYNSYVAAQEKKAWRRMVMSDVLKNPSIKRYTFGTRAATAVFVVATLKPADVEKQLFAFIPNETAVWALWRRTVARTLQSGKLDLSVSGEDEAALGADGIKLLHTLLGDAQAALTASA